MMPTSVSVGSLSIALGFLIAGLSQSPLTYAQCAPDPTVVGGTVTCAGTDPDGFTSAFDNITVNVTGAVNTALPNFHALDFSGTGVNVQMTGSGSITPALGGDGHPPESRQQHCVYRQRFVHYGRQQYRRYCAGGEQFANHH
jgi:hypothetical protein